MGFRRAALPLLLPFCLLGALLAEPALAVRWPVAGWPAGDGLVSRNLDAFSSSVGQGSGGGLTLAPLPADSGATVLRALAEGRAPAGLIPMAALEPEEPALAMDRVAWLSTNLIQARKLWSVLRPEVARVLDARGLTLLYAVVEPPAAPLSRRPLTAAADWKGARLVKQPASLGALSTLLGVKAVNGTSAKALLGGDKADIAFVGVGDAASGAAWEYASHYLHAPAWFPKHLVVARHDALDGLDDRARTALVVASRGASETTWTAAGKATEASVQKLRDYGIKTAEPPVNLLIRLEAVGRELLFRWSDSAGETGARLVESYYAIR